MSEPPNEDDLAAQLEDPRPMRAYLKEAPAADVEYDVPGGTHEAKASRQVGGIDCLFKYATTDEELRLVKNEVAASIIDELLELGMVPATVLRVVPRPGHEGEFIASIQEWVDGEPFVGVRELDEKATIEAAAVDWLIENLDRNMSNLLMTGPEQPHGIALIDHGRCFGFNSQPRRELWSVRRNEPLSAEFLARVANMVALIRNNDELRTVLTSGQIDRLIGRAETLMLARRVPMTW
jgi:hypothetical protein